MKRKANKSGSSEDSFDPFRRALRHTQPSRARDDAMSRVILSIPAGYVSSYAKVAAAAGYPGYHRQAAQLLRRDGVDLPWQRVVGAGGEIKTRFEHGDTQRRLLEAEGVRFRGERVDMERFEFELRPWESAE
ncbi:MAG: MGMT family protein [Bryobacterales bacterium]|nr:MGMT family protein [Bryobacterales bacterium]